jgi:ubiquinone/menaquinone biosynthesis C-methylase UbiE
LSALVSSLPSLRWKSGSRPKAFRGEYIVGLSCAQKTGARGIQVAKRVCPFWIGYLLINPIRNLFENPYKRFGHIVREGMVVLEPGCGMGYFTLPLARLVGGTGRVIAIDIQPEMIAALGKRALRAGLLERIQVRLGESDSLKIEDLCGTVDLAVAMYMVHESVNHSRFFKEIWNALKTGGKLLVVEPRGHVSIKEFEKSIGVAREVGFIQNDDYSDLKRRKVLLHKFARNEKSVASSNFFLRKGMHNLSQRPIRSGGEQRPYR